MRVRRSAWHRVISASGAARADKKQRICARAEWAAGALLLGASVIINGTGAVSQPASDWNLRPVNVDDAPGRVWDWRDPQFLRGTWKGTR